MAAKKKQPSGIARAIAAADSQKKLADHLGVTQQAVGKWLLRGFVPPKRAREIELLTGVPRADLVDPQLLDALDGEVKL